jgi:O-acetyl-ADP-ribose deacetylase (regulator of RNase III)
MEKKASSMLHEKIKFTKKTPSELEADVILSYNSTDLVWRGPGIANTLAALDKSGDLARACGKTNSLKVGTAVLLPGGDLPFRFVCQAAIAGIGQDSTEISIRAAIRWAFSVMSERRLETIVVPTLYTETNMPIGLSADILLRECLVHISSDPRIKSLTIMAQSEVEYKQYRNLAKGFSK